MPSSTSIARALCVSSLLLLEHPFSLAPRNSPLDHVSSVQDHKLSPLATSHTVWSIIYQSNLNTYFKSYLSIPAPPPDISATPSPWDFTIDDWVCKGTAGSGGFGTVSAAKHRITGEPAAAKTLMRTSKISIASRYPC
jgi:hypothetical protein